MLAPGALLLLSPFEPKTNSTDLEVYKTMSQPLAIPSQSPGAMPYWESQRTLPPLKIGRPKPKEQLAMVRVVEFACTGIQNDIASVKRDFPRIPTDPETKGIYTQFVESLVFKVERILVPALEYVRHCPRELVVPEVEVHFGAATKGLDHVKELLDDWKKDLSGDWIDARVPTASPHQLACQLRLLKENTNKCLQSNTKILFDLQGKCFPIIGYEPSMKLQNGKPSMLYLAVYDQHIESVQKKHILLGANNVSWWDPATRTRIDAFHRITKALRDHRLTDIVTPASNALKALRAREAEALGIVDVAAARKRIMAGDEPTLSEEEKECRYKARIAAIQTMRQHQDFLRLAGEVGVAMQPPYFNEALPCYFCQGMMGCTSARSVTNKKARGNIIRPG